MPNPSSDRAIAIVGVGAILPDALSAPIFWQNIVNKRYCISETPANRWSIVDYYDPDPTAPDKTYSKIGGWVQGYQFDWKKYRIPPKVAAAMDEGQQWAVTIADEALTDYGYPNRPLDTERTGVILGTAMGGELHYITQQRIVFPEFAHALDAAPGFASLSVAQREAILQQWRDCINAKLPPITEDTMPGELPNIVAGRVANVLNLRGTNFITDAACASSFAAINAAFEMLTEHHIDAVIAGGVDRNMGATVFVKFCKIGALSATGSRPFGDGADGFVMGEGSAAFLLKRLSDAERDRDKIYAVIRGVGASSDGKGKGITAPNPQGQVLSAARAWENAGLDPATATLIEAHGTSTKVGDVVEVESLTKVFGGAPRGSIGLGSAKSNIGHLKAGAGAAGLLKATMAIHHKLLPPTLNCERPNPNIDFDKSPFYLLCEPRAWEQPRNFLRRAGVSAYGFGGTNFHIVLEEYAPGMLKAEPKVFAAAVNGGQGASGAINTPSTSISQTTSQPMNKKLLRGILSVGARTPTELKDKLDDIYRRVEAGWMPERQAPPKADLEAPERLFIDFGTQEELLDRISKARKAAGFDNPQAWKALQGQGVFRGSGSKPGEIAFLFPGQGSQYVNMGRQLAEREPVVAQVFKDADGVMTPILGKPLTSYIFVENQDPEAMTKAERDLMQTAITQPAMLTMDTALYKLLSEYGFAPDMVMGHSLGEYAALIAAGIMPFAHALEASAARGAEMTKVSVEDNGWMAAVMAPLNVVEETLKEVNGYVVAANINSYNQAVIGGASKAVEQAIGLFEKKGFRAMRIPVSHAFHTKIVAPASGPLRKVLDRLSISSPSIPLVANVTGDIYPTNVAAIKDTLELQIASPVQWVKGLETMYRKGVRCFVEVGPKRALKGFVDDVLGGKPDVWSLLTNHPKTGEIESFNQALCGLYAAGYGAEGRGARSEERGASAPVVVSSPAPVQTEVKEGATMSQSAADSNNALGQVLLQALQQLAGATAPLAYDRNETPQGSVVITGTGLGLPGANKSVMDPDNAMRILRGEQFVDLIPERFRKQMAGRRITRLVKGDDGSGHFEVIEDTDDVIKLAGRGGAFDLAEEYGVPAKLIEALDITTQLSIAAGLDALREAGIPLVQTYRPTSKGTYLPDRWLLPEALRDETGVIFASAFPGGDRMADEFRRYHEWENRRQQLAALEDLRQYTTDPTTLREIMRRIGELKHELEQNPYEFDRRFIFRILAMGHSQFAEYIGARGPNTHVNAACASTAQGVALAEDWIRNGRCRRVIVVGADDVTSENLLGWVGAGFLATGAAATDDKVDEAALPFDRRRHGTLLGMGACALVVESEDAARERGMRGIVELLSSETANSAFHGTRLDVNHISDVMNRLVTAAERRFGLNRYTMAPQMAFISHETFTPARGGSASAEVMALRSTFGEAAVEIVVCNTKGFTGHPMGAGVEDVIAVKILEHGIVPPVSNYKEVDPDLGVLNLSRGGRYPVQYALHLAAGFGSQIAMTLIRRIPGSHDRIDNKARYQRWLADVSGYDRAETEVVKRVLRIVAQGQPARLPIASDWQCGTGPVVRAAAPGDGMMNDYRPLPMPAVAAGVRGDGRWASVEIGKGGERETLRPAAPAPVAPAPAPAPKIAEPVAPSPAPKVAELIAPTPTPVQAAPPPVAPVAQSPISQSPAADPVIDQVLDVVAGKTGYPKDMLDLDLDLEADLGIDTVKQAETFAAIRETFAIPVQEGLNLRDYPTLSAVVGFVRKNRPDLAGARGEERGATPTAAAPAAPIAQSPNLPITQSPISTLHSPAADPVVDKVLTVVAEKTGYPKDMLELDLDLEADLGIDTVKQAETFASIRETFAIPVQEGLNLRDYPTLNAVVGFVRQHRPDLAVARGEGRGASRSAVRSSESAVAAAPVAQSPNLSISNLQSPAGDEITERVLDVVSAKTGYPKDMLELDLDLEADLGIDTVKQAETFATVREAFNIPVQEGLNLRDYPTLASVVGFVKSMRPDLAEGEKGRQEDKEAASQATPIAQSPNLQSPISTVKTIGTLEDADKMPRRVPVPALRPSIDLCKPTGVTIDAGSRIVVMLDQGGVGKKLVERLQKRGATVLTLEPGIATDDLDNQLRAWLAEGKIQGVFWLPALDVEQAIEEMTLEEWRELNRVRVKNLYTAMRALYDSVTGPNTFLVSATRLGGLHGYGPTGATAPLGGAVVGFTKAYNMEQAMREGGKGVTVKAVDFEPSRKLNEPADQLIAEALFDPGVVEVGYFKDQRFTVTLEEIPAKDGNPGMVLDKNTVFVVTGAAGGITSAITADLAANSGGVFYLLDLVPAPARDDRYIALFRQGRDTLKNALIAEARASGEKVTPKQIDDKIMGLERQEAALRAIEAVEAAGGMAYYYSLDLRDGDKVTAVVEDIRQRHGKIDVLLHAGGLLIDRVLPNKEPHQFALVFDVKADGFFSLLKAAKGMPIGATVSFSSVAGRFGNNGQSDYSSANDLLCKISSSMRTWRPDTRGIAIDWTAWGQIGMASRGSVQAILESLGVDMLPPEAGVPTIRRELTYGATRGEVVVAGRLGAWLDEKDPTGGLDVDKLNAQLAERKNPLLMVGQVKSFRLYGGIEVETTLDPKVQPFLFDHAPDAGTPWLPGVMATEALAQLASIAAPGYRVASVENEQMMGAFKFFRMEPRTLYLSATVKPAANGDLLAKATLRSVTKPAKEGLPVQVKEHFIATVRLTTAPAEQPVMAFTPPAAESLPITAATIYKSFFHGPAYQVIERAGVSGNECLALMAHDLGPNTEPAHAASLMAPRLVELCFQSAALWTEQVKGAMGLPLGFDKMTAYRQPEEAEGRRLYCVCTTANDGESFDATVVDEAGNVFVTLAGYLTVARPA